MEQLEPYSEYKDSGQPWLGMVPAHWALARLRTSVLNCQNGLWGSDPNGVDDIPCVRVADFDRVNFRVKPNVPTQRAITEKERRGRTLQPDDLLLEKSGGGDLQPVGVVVSYGHNNGPAVCSNFIARMSPASGFNSRFLVYLNAALYCHGINRLSIKQTTGIQNLDAASYLSQRVAFPPPDEQAAIVRFLGALDRPVNRFVRAKRRLIELLTEQKQAIITHAVTRGLNPNAKLKPSGIDWLGDVPADWTVLRLKRAARLQGGYAFPAAEFSDSGIRVIRMNNLRRGALSTSGAVRVPTESCQARFAIKAGDLLYGLSGSIGATGSLGNYARATESDLPAQLNQRVGRFVVNARRLSTEFLEMLIQSSSFYQQVLAATTGTAQFNVSPQDVDSVFTALPPLIEQQSILGFVKGETQTVNAAIVRIKREIDLIREYRTRLVADVVTGKLDVRAAAARLPDDEPAAMDDTAASVGEDGTDEVDGDDSAMELAESSAED